MSSSVSRRKRVRGRTRAMMGALLLMLVSQLGAAQTGKVQAIGGLTDPAVPEMIRSVLAAKGYRILPEASGAPVELWYRKEIPVEPKPSASDALYDRLAESTLLGVIHLEQAFADYRGQPVPAGFYTLRYALMPNDGNHLGVAPNRDFLLLIPANADPGPEKLPNFQDLINLSRRASGTGHPAPLSLVQADGGTGAGLSKDDEGHVIFSAAIHLASGGDLALALVVKGTAPQ